MSKPGNTKYHYNTRHNETILRLLARGNPLSAPSLSDRSLSLGITSVRQALSNLEEEGVVRQRSVLEDGHRSKVWGLTSVGLRRCKSSGLTKRTKLSVAELTHGKRK